MSGVIGFEAVTVTYEDAAAPVLRDFSLSVEEGELCLVAGRTGVGKSTVLGAINGLVPHFTGGRLAGRVTVDGEQLRTGDALKVTAQTDLTITTDLAAELILIDVPLDFEPIGVWAQER